MNISNGFKEFTIKCNKCGSESVNIYMSRGGCDSCSYGDSTQLTCNNCKNIESID